ncbi:hypothetical protein, partial [Kluyvera ascorbata]|uniref:hypothetical protein n=1 Tax=Kluyvera ascorbata TaxID=51288 RepID=UPI001B3045EF
TLNSKKMIITSTQNISYNFNSKYFYEFLTRNPEQYDFDVYYVINNKEKRQELNNKYKTIDLLNPLPLVEYCFA